jgi:molybdopterin-guanine dinucleotide biosynthesis protein
MSPSPRGLHLADKLHHRRRDTKGRDLMRHPQEGSRSVGVVHDEELLAVTSATSIGLIPRHTAMLSANG